MGDLSQYHGCWCPGSLHRQDISNHGIGLCRVGVVTINEEGYEIPELCSVEKIMENSNIFLVFPKKNPKKNQSNGWISCLIIICWIAWRPIITDMMLSVDELGIIYHIPSAFKLVSRKIITVTFLVHTGQIKQKLWMQMPWGAFQKHLWALKSKSSWNFKIA